jgi:GrpB-like predicted nucleotidyltransferase (UPF0157 family)
VTIGAPERLSGTVRLSGYDPAWPAAYRRESARIRAALPARVLRLEHVGSTSIPGLPAKPIIDIVLEVPDSSAEPAYASSLEAAGYVLRIREPEWFEHRLFNSPDAEVNLHVFSDRCPETDRMVLFRDRLRSSTADRDLYARSKQASASRRWAHVQQYADAKTEVITTILSRAHGAPGD